MRVVRVVRNVEFGRLFDAFFVSAISTILVIRFALQLSGYPQIGNKTLHISHLLPGSLLMLAAFLLLLGAVNRSVRDFSAVIAGIGFGLVWDEVGKFTTQNNDYFFKAAPGLIYITFVVLYLIARYAAAKRFTQDDYIANVLDLLKDAAIKDLDEREYEHAKELMTHVSPDHPLYESTLEILKKVKPTAHSEVFLIDRVVNAVMRPIKRLSRKPKFRRTVIIVSSIYGLASLFVAEIFFYGVINDSPTAAAILKGEESDFIGAVSALAAALLVAYGVFKYAHGRIARAYKLFQISLLVNIFVGEIVLFFKSPKVAMAGLAITVILLVNVNILIEESARKRLRKQALPV